MTIFGAGTQFRSRNPVPARSGAFRPTLTTVYRLTGWSKKLITSSDVDQFKKNFYWHNQQSLGNKKSTMRTLNALFSLSSEFWWPYETLYKSYVLID